MSYEFYKTFKRYDKKLHMLKHDMKEIERRNNRLRKINLCTKTCEDDYTKKEVEYLATLNALRALFPKAE